jgi:chemotaxis protein CheD
VELDNGYSQLRIKVPKSSASATTYLHPGQMTVSAEPVTVMTILGSCVAVCLWDSVRRVGGMVHYLLPRWEPHSGFKTPRYGDIAIESLLEKMKALNCRTTVMQARVFGGGCVLKAFRNPGKGHLGERNAEIAHQLLEQYRIPLIECDTLGNTTRKVTFHTETGIAKVTRIGDGDAV